MFGTHLSVAFRATSKHISVSKGKEVPLFRAFIDAFDALYIMGLDVNVISSEIHRVFGFFDVDTSFYTGGLKDVKREIGDLLLIMYSKKKSVAKISFIQCKHHHSLSVVPPSIFKGDIFQFYLMSKRPIVNSCRHPLLNRYPDFYHNALIPSVTSYGVFYKSKTNFEFAYFNSEHLSITGIPFTIKKYPQHILFTGTYSYVNKSYPFGDVNGTKDIKEFGDSIEKLNIGTIINNNTKKVINRIYPNSPETFKNLELDDNLDVTDRRNFDIIIQQTKTVVFINIDNIPLDVKNESEYDLYIKLKE